MKRFAVIDLGTNTFHLLIAGRKSDGSFIEIYRERIYVRLGQEGIYRFGKAANKRALDAMRKFRQVVNLFEAIEVRAFATAAFRTAQNADILIHRIAREFDIRVEIISGHEEARLIYEGVKYGGALQPGDNIIMDIGGGSVEFIIGSQSEIKWSVSLPLGASLLKNQYHQNEPISKMEVCSLRHDLKDALALLDEKMKDYSFDTMIGSSGTFDVLAEAIPVIEKIGRCQILRTKDFNSFLDEVQSMSLDARISHPSIPENRADLIVVALILLDEVLRLNVNFKYLLVSPFALKEGMVSEMIASYSSTGLIPPG